MSKESSTWMSMSDMMTGLMVIFLFIAIAYMSEVNENSVNLADYVESKRELHDRFIEEFKKDTANWQMQIGKDLSIRFTNPEVLFATGSWRITPAFKKILSEFMPRYLDILLTNGMKNQIKEIRIEGHTDNVPYPSLNYDPYIANVILSQRRALGVLEYIRKLSYYKDFTIEKKNLLEFLFTANGLSYGRTLDNEKDYTFFSHKEIDKKASRRVEFRIITNSDQLIKEFIEKNINTNE